MFSRRSPPITSTSSQKRIGQILAAAIGEAQSYSGIGCPSIVASVHATAARKSVSGRKHGRVSRIAYVLRVNTALVLIPSLHCHLPTALDGCVESREAQAAVGPRHCLSIYKLCAMLVPMPSSSFSTREQRLDLLLLQHADADAGTIMSAEPKGPSCALRLLPAIAVRCGLHRRP